MRPPVNLFKIDEKAPLQPINPSPIYSSNAHGRFAKALGRQDSIGAEVHKPPPLLDGKTSAGGVSRKSSLAEAFATDSRPAPQPSIIQNTSKLLRALQDSGKREPRDLSSSDLERSYRRSSKLSSGKLDSSYKSNIVRQRKVPQTQFEVLGSSATLVLIFFPWILLLFTSYLDYFVSCSTPSVLVTSSSCPPPLSCLVTNTSAIIHLQQSFLLTQYVGLSIGQNLSAVDIGFSTGDSLGMIRPSIPLANNEKGHEPGSFGIYCILSASGMHSGKFEQFGVLTMAPFSADCSNQSAGCQISPNALSLAFNLDQPDVNANSDVLRLNLTYQGEPPEHAEEIFKSLQFRLSFESAQISLFRSWVVVILFLLTAYRLFRSCWQSAHHVERLKVGEETRQHPLLESMLPEQMCCILLLFWLLLWLNILSPLSNFMAILGLGYVPDGLLFTAGFLRTVGEQGMYFSILVLFDGLKYASNGYDDDDEEDQDAPDNSSRRYAASNRGLHGSDGSLDRSNWFELDRSRAATAAYGPSWLSSDAPPPPPPKATRKKVKYTGLNESVHGFPGHHPLSPFYADFILLKLLFLLLAIVLSFSVWMLKFPGLFGLKSVSLPGKIFEEDCLATVEIVMFIVCIFWVIFIVQAMVTSGSRLRKLPYMITRFRQMAYRLLMSQVSAGTIMLLATAYFQIKNTFSMMNFQSSSLTSLWKSLVEGIKLAYQNGVGSWSFNDSNELGSGGTVFIAFICYVLSYIFVAPWSADVDTIVAEGTSHEFAILERDVDALGKKVAIDHRTLKPFSKYPMKTIFCLETACKLLECSWQAYFPPSLSLQDLTEDDSIAKLIGTDVTVKMDTSSLNLTPRAFYKDNETSTWGYLATENGKRRVIITFRGTARYQNVTTDFQWNQMTLPNLQLTKRYFVNLLRATRNLPQIADENNFESLTKSFILNFRSNSGGLSDTDADYDNDIDMEFDNYETFHPENSFDAEDVHNHPQSPKSMPDFVKGVTAMHIDKGVCEVLERHMDDFPNVYYTIKLDDGREVQTTSEKLTILAPITDSTSSLPRKVELMQCASGENEPIVRTSSSSAKSPRVSSKKSAQSPGEKTYDCQGLQTKLPTMEEISQSSVCNCFRDLISSLPLARDTLPRVHSGFWTAYSTVREEVLLSVALAVASDIRDVLNTPPLVRQASVMHPEDIEALLAGSASYEDDIISSLQIQFCGHSLGGALAVLAALDVSVNLQAIVRAAIILHFPKNYQSAGSNVVDFYDIRAKQASLLPRLSVYTFGTPRIGNSVFTGLIEEVLGLDKYYRVEVDGDMVLDFPPPGYYYHGGTQVLVDSEGIGSIVVKPTIVESHLLSSSGSTILNHGLTVYRNSLEACFEDSELREYLESTHSGSNSNISRNTSEDEFPEWFVGRR